MNLKKLSDDKIKNTTYFVCFQDIKKLSQIEGRKRTTNAANIDANKAKNRYVNILSCKPPPYD